MLTVIYTICPYFSSDTTFDAYMDKSFNSYHEAINFLMEEGFTLDPMCRGEKGNNIVGICPTMLLDGKANGNFPPSFIKYAKK